MNMKIASVLLFMSVIGLGVCGLASAEIKLEKNVEYVDIVPGKTTSGTIIVDNSSNQEVTVKAYQEDLLYVAPFDGTREAKPLGSTPCSLGQFTVVEPALFKISPYGSQKVTYSVTAPNDAKGGYYGVIFFERVASSQSQGFGITLRLGYKLLAEAQDKTQEILLKDVAAEGDGFSGKFANTGNVIIFSDPTFTVIDNMGMVSDRGAVRKEMSLPPGEETAFKIALSKDIPAGSYTLMIDFDLQGRGALSKEIGFSKDETGRITIVTKGNAD